MTKLEYIKERLSDTKLREDLSKVVEDVDALIPQNEEDFLDIYSKVRTLSCRALCPICN